MSEKGGEKANKNDLTAVDSKIILTTIICVFLGAVLVLGLILFGMEVNSRYLGSLDSDPTPVDNVTEVIAVRHETKTFTYNPGVDTNGSDRMYSSYDTLLKKIGGKNGYYLIKSSSEYDKVINEIKLLSGREGIDSFEIDNDFFNSGSVILITAEKPGLSYFGINSVTRDGDYNIYINTSSVDANDTINVEGKAILVKIDNIQPKYVEVTERSE